MRIRRGVEIIEKGWLIGQDDVPMIHRPSEPIPSDQNDGEGGETFLPEECEGVKDEEDAQKNYDVLGVVAVVEGRHSENPCEHQAEEDVDSPQPLPVLFWCRLARRRWRGGNQVNNLVRDFRFRLEPRVREHYEPDDRESDKRSYGKHGCVEPRAMDKGQVLASVTQRRVVPWAVGAGCP